MRILLIAGGLTVAACAPQAPGSQVQPRDVPIVPEQQQGNTTVEDLDPFVVMIGAERWTVILDRALEGASQAPEPSGVGEQTDLYRADAALKRGAAMVIALRNSVCEKGLVTGAACNLPDWPAWATELPTSDTPLAELDRRSAWLSDVMGPFTEASCEAGRKASGDALFCSVE